MNIKNVSVGMALAFNLDEEEIEQLFASAQLGSSRATLRLSKLLGVRSTSAADLARMAADRFEAAGESYTHQATGREAFDDFIQAIAGSLGLDRLLVHLNRIFLRVFGKECTTCHGGRNKIWTPDSGDYKQVICPVCNGNRFV